MAETCELFTIVTWVNDTPTKSEIVLQQSRNYAIVRRIEDVNENKSESRRVENSFPQVDDTISRFDEFVGEETSTERSWNFWTENRDNLN